MTASSQISFLAGFANSVFVTRGLGPQDYGLYAYLIWMVGMAVSLSTGALNVTTIRFVAEAVGAKDEAQARALSGFLRRLLWLGLLAMATVLGATWWLPGVHPAALTDRLALYLGFTVACAALKATYMFEASVGKGHALFQAEALPPALIGLVTLPLNALLCLSGQSLDAYLLLFAGASLAHPLLARHMLKQQGLLPDDTPLTQESRTRVWHALGWHTSFTLVGLLSTKSLDIYLLGLHALPAFVGYYNIASSLARAGLDVLSSGFSSVLLPSIARAGAEGGRDQVQAIFEGAVRLYQCMGILVAAGAWLLAEPLVTLLYGTPYLEAVPALRVMALVGGILLPNAAYSAVFIASDHHRARLLFITLSSAISVITSLTFIPWLGWEGALISVFAGNVVTYLLVAVLAHTVLKIRFPLVHVLRHWLCAGLAFAAVLWALPTDAGTVQRLLGCGVFGLLYLVLSLHLGAWPDSDLALVRHNSKHLGRLLSLLTLRQHRT
ncbi:lipopolysaccharide biosynthesis protein [Aquabacterium sp.]|uniref:lipopolysaccharide biosynthesis protein n=1 Tax=Aquabacterium sp. TaxID=1872578 RepID=UPI002489B8A7|nr:lipopolysaccharide biosynthesis protein [Aquabacterium sp.]MDI1350044.1 lipopolysaccharide biosynthesis protein [Aquabacterium sp.]